MAKQLNTPPHSPGMEVLVSIDEDGDTELYVDSPSSGTHVFEVCRSAVCKISPYFKNLLAGSFAEKHLREIQLNDLDPEGLTILLRIAHLQFREVPDVLDIDTLVAVAKVTHVCLAAHVVRPWVRGWLEGVRETAAGRDYDKLIWVAYEFGEMDLFERVMVRLIHEVAVGEDGSCVTASGAELHWDLMPPGSDIVEHILTSRNKAIDALLAMCYSYMDAISDASATATGICKDFNYNKTEGQACDALNFGSLALSLQRLGLWPERKSARTLGMSVDELQSRLKEIAIFTYCGTAQEHDSCNFEAELKERIRDVGIPDAVSDLHKNHIEHQKSELLTAR